jgi:hypothetical protein
VLPLHDRANALDHAQGADARLTNALPTSCPIGATSSAIAAAHHDTIHED